MIADFPQKVGFLTRELAAFHEAAHVVTAIKTGALVHKAELINKPHPHGRSRIERNDAFQGICIACAGFAAEYELLEKGIMINAEGHKATFDEGFAEAMTNVAEDFKNFRRAHEQLADMSDASMDSFIGTALTQVRPWLDFNEVRAVAARLLLQGELDGKQIEELIPYPTEDEAKEALSKIFPKNC